MAITTGTDTFVSVSDADAFWSSRNDSDWSNATTAAKEAALIKATEFIDNEYEWPGTIEDTDQALSWPRSFAYDNEGRQLEGIPSAVENATAYLAGQQIKGIDIFQVKQRNQRTKRLKAGSVEIEYEENARQDAVYDYLKSILSKITNTSTSQIKLVRT